MTCNPITCGTTWRAFFGRFAFGLGDVALAQWVSALKGRDVIAQGEALGTAVQTSTALKGRHNGMLLLWRPFRAEVHWMVETQGVALGCNLTAFQASPAA